MTKIRKITLGIGLASVVLTGGCATTSGWETQSAGADFPNGVRVLGEAVLLPTREQVIANEGLLNGWRDKLLEAGYRDEDLVDGSEVTVWAYCYGWNSGVPLCAHHGHYVAHIPPELRGQLTVNDDGNPETAGDLLDVELTRTPSGQIVGRLISIYRRSADWGPCRQARLEQESLLASLAGVGPPRAAWIECDNVESDGWVRRPVPGAPSSNGPPISQWFKLPQ